MFSTGVSVIISIITVRSGLEVIRESVLVAAFGALGNMRIDPIHGGTV